jgi:hypothetical protein
VRIPLHGSTGLPRHFCQGGKRHAGLHVKAGICTAQVVRRASLVSGKRASAPPCARTS